MASIINASNSTGLTLTSDLSGVLQLQQNGVALPALSVAPAFSAYQGTAQTFSTGTWAKLNLQTEEFDTNNNFDSTTNYRFTPTVAGYYQLNGNVYVTFSISPGNNHAVGCAIYKNGTEVKEGNVIRQTTVAGSCGAVVSALIYMNGTTDYVELYYYTDTSGTGTTGANYRNYFQGYLARGA